MGMTIPLPDVATQLSMMWRGVLCRDRPRRSTATMVNDPFTLVVALDESGGAEGDLYLDDGHSFAFTQGAYLHRK